MKKLFFIFMLAGSLPLLAYDITVTNATTGNVVVSISKPDQTFMSAERLFCREPNHGDTLKPGETNWWPTHNDCTNRVHFKYPDGSGADVIAHATNKDFTVYRDARGQYHYR